MKAIGPTEDGGLPWGQSDPRNCEIQADKTQVTQLESIEDSTCTHVTHVYALLISADFDP